MASPSYCPPLLVATGLPASFSRLSSPPLPVVEGKDDQATENGILLDPENPDLPPAAVAKVPASDDTDDDDDDVDGTASSHKKQKPHSSFTSLPSTGTGLGPPGPRLPLPLFSVLLDRTEALCSTHKGRTCIFRSVLIDQTKEDEEGGPETGVEKGRGAEGPEPGREGEGSRCQRGEGEGDGAGRGLFQMGVERKYEG